MSYSKITRNGDPITGPISCLDGLIAAAKANLTTAEAAVKVDSAALDAIEPHPHAHGHTAGQDCIYAGIATEQYVALAGLLAQPWRGALGIIVALQQEQRLDYLLKALPLAMAEMGDMLIENGIALLDARGDRLDQDLPELFERRPLVALGLVWRLFGFYCRDRDGWVGLFAYDADLAELIGSTSGITDDLSLGDAFAATVATCHLFLDEIGKAELCRRAARRDDDRQSSWAAVPQSYREGGPWRGLAPTKRQRHLMQRIEAARCLPTTLAGRRGETSDWIKDAGGNPRFDTSNEEQA